MWNSYNLTAFHSLDPYKYCRITNKTAEWKQCCLNGVISDMYLFAQISTTKLTKYTFVVDTVYSKHNRTEKTILDMYTDEIKYFCCWQ